MEIPAVLFADQGNWIVHSACPPHLEYLAAIDQLLIRQDVDCLGGTCFVKKIYFNTDLPVMWGRSTQAGFAPLEFSRIG